MKWPAESLGPFDPVFNRKFGKYMRNSPTPPQKECLYEFFERLRNGPVNNKYRHTKDIFVVYACEHILFLTAGGSRAHKIKPEYK